MALSVSLHKQALAVPRTRTSATSTSTTRAEERKSGGSGGGKYHMGRMCTTLYRQSLQNNQALERGLLIGGILQTPECRQSALHNRIHLLVGSKSPAEAICFLTGFVDKHFIAIF
jgi:hypothetical protein